MERKKSHKAKTKPSEGRKQLSSVRVIQRNLVYIVGLPLNLADEDVFSLSLPPLSSPIFLNLLLSVFEILSSFCSTESILVNTGRF
jgi:CCR4-NOT transcription complex subunit 4